MTKYVLVLLLLLKSFLTLAFADEVYPKAYFSPHQGEIAFSKMYGLISNAREYAHITIYSWSDSNLDKAISAALANNVKVRVVLHRPLAKKSYILSKVKKLEAKGAEFKIAFQNMHEKFVLVDDEYLINSSANMSRGAKSRYSESFIFHKRLCDIADPNCPEDPLNDIVEDFKHEFAIMWNSSKDIVTHGEQNALPLGSYTKIVDGQVLNLPRYIPAPDDSISLFSSSMNWTVQPNKPESSRFKKGQYIKMKRRGGLVRNQTWLIRDELIRSIDNAKCSVHLSLNHFNIRAISDALIKAVLRGVEVKLAVDNQEFKSRPNNKEMTPQFVKDWKLIPGHESKIPPVRVKFYSHQPSPRHWYLNHHKFILVDFKPLDNSCEVSDPHLLSGSYNLSRTAEQKQFDNLVLYRGIKYVNLYQQFKDEFDGLWFLNRDESDRPKAEILDKFYKTFEGSYRIHLKTPISLNWNEITQVKSKIKLLADGIFQGLFRKRDCTYYDPDNKLFQVFDVRSRQLVECPF
ncbi:MAG: phosphatidylserine/phosphatidylglycerophosphate/cardiolipin synthase family protein [Bacteriovoracaceae bacterium]|nr:phosphatidylserine/phosphatidylglycerophosphate/cardiolipin synthase family protein [Bacteriovoracaceae bacterium]